MDRLADMRLLLDAAALGSFSAAGRRHGISPAAASASIQRLEAALGVRLFERTTRQLRPTEEGNLYLRYCQQALDTMDEAERAVQAGRDMVRGALRISAPSDLGRNLLLDLIDAFSRRHPEVKLALTLTDALSNLVLDDLDVAIRVGTLRDSGMVARKLADSWRIVCASPDCIARHGLPARAADLAVLPTVVLVTSNGPQDEWQLGGEPVRLAHFHESNDSEVMRKWALQGKGFAYKPIWAVMDDLRAGRLVAVNPDRWADPAPLNALYHRSAFQPARLRLFLDFLQVEFAARVGELADFGLPLEGRG